MSRSVAALMGALVADAAGLGLHWLYDIDRIAQVVGDGSAAFVPLDPANFEGVPAYFAHAARRDGQLSQYGETLALALRSIAAEDGFVTAAYQTAFAEHFGAGGSFQGYIDRPTKGTLANIAAEQLAPSGIDDDQHPAITTLPAIVARYGNDPAKVTEAMQVTNVNAVASHYASIFAQCLAAVLDGTDLHRALADAAQSEPLLQQALDSTQDPIAYGETTSRACHLPQGMPLSWRILSHTTSYRDAVETNIRAGGDSAGRAMIIGALAGAAYGMESIPLEWILNTEDAKTLWSLAQKI